MKAIVYDRAALLERAEQFALAQEQLAADSAEDRRHWHHVSLANLIRELASALSSQNGKSPEIGG